MALDWDNIIITTDEYSYSIDAEQRMIIFSGAPGSAGPAGPQGPAATIAVGTTTTLPAGSNATVENVGTDTAAVFNFGIPRGSSGGGGGDAMWGEIGGTLSDQTDLNTALAAKADSADLGTMAEIDDAPSDGSEYVRKNGSWSIAEDVPEAITVYVDGTNGSDSNDGSSEHPFATIAKAISEVPAGIMDASLIHVAAGTYAERLEIESKFVTLNLDGDVTVNNTIQVLNNSYVQIYGASGRTLTINSSLTVYSNSVVSHNIAMVITSQYNSLNVVESKFINSYNANLTLISTGNSTYGVNATTSSLVFLGTVNITANTGIKSTTGAVVAYDTLTGTMTTQTVQDIGGRIYTGSGGSGSATAWGDITGTLSNQTDLSTALAAKANSADLGDLATQDTVDYATEVTNKPTLGSIAAANYTISSTDLTDGTSPLTTGDLYFYYEA